jgi:sugar O-acyltransferase (sialic acid O-acetyltransferase NeuD family)
MYPDRIIIGYSGHAYVVCDILLQNKYNIIGYCEMNEKKDNPFNLLYLGKETERVFTSEEIVFTAVGDNNIREKIYNNLYEKANFGSAYHPSASISHLVNIGAMVMIGAGAVINPLANIGNGAIINTRAVVEHECMIGDFAHIAPGAVLAGNVIIGARSFIGAGAVVKQGISICNDVIVGAGAVVVKDINEPGIYIGIPAKKM